ncbi:D-alanyl-D-alanine carboxypeptidase [Bdellovibrio sp.]|uniref:D-alanyl-D-alanine carboxypeptidase n=1 Tax=Bdellovibrio TaxID=958 RepID=UPI003221BD98
MITALTKKILHVSVGTLLISSAASAKVYLNSMCHMAANSTQGVVQGDKTKDDKFPLASISKVVTTLWAIDRLGPDYRYATKLHITPTANGAVDIHIEGSRDPMFGRNLGYFLMSELNRMKIKKIEKMTFDENFLLTWRAEEKPLIAGTTPKYETIEEQAAVVRSTLINAFGTGVNSLLYKNLRAKAAKNGVQMVESPSVSIRNVAFTPKASFQKAANTQTAILRSAPLRSILKRMNNQSNNYIADTMFWNLGGTEKFEQYVKTTLAASDEDIVFHNGSGNNEGSVAKPIYNEATCEMMVKILYRLDKNLSVKGYDLSDVMAVAGKDRDSTVRGYGGNMAGSTIAKTGSVNKAKTLAGSISTKNGEIYFAVLMHTDQDQNRSDWGVASQQIKTKVAQLISTNGGPKKVNYTEQLPLPFDAKSYLVSPTVPAVVAKK